MNISKKVRILSISTFVFYIIILLWITIFKCNVEASVRGAQNFLAPMTIGERFAYAMSYFSPKDGATIDMLLNIFIFIPFGILVPLFSGRTAPLATAVLALLSSFFIECLQLISAFGYFTYIDLICNTAGAVLGIIIYSLFIRKMRDNAKFNALIFCSFIAATISFFTIISTALNFEIYL